MISPHYHCYHPYPQRFHYYGHELFYVRVGTMHPSIWLILTMSFFFRDYETLSSYPLQNYVPIFYTLSGTMHLCILFPGLCALLHSLRDCLPSYYSLRDHVPPCFCVVIPFHWAYGPYYAVNGYDITFLDTLLGYNVTQSYSYVTCVIMFFYIYQIYVLVLRFGSHPQPSQTSEF